MHILARATGDMSNEPHFSDVNSYSHRTYTLLRTSHNTRFENIVGNNWHAITHSLPMHAECNLECTNGGTPDAFCTECLCLQGFTGQLCETDIDDCSGVTCASGGTCVDLVNGFRCDCVVGFTGQLCETDVDDCSGVTCMNGGTCVDLVNDFRCDCVVGFTGQLCETDVDDCSGITCMNEGTCVDLVNDFRCDCVVGFTGQLCETDVDDCSGVTCMNGGTCVDLLDDFRCDCVPEYTGQFCGSPGMCFVLRTSFVIL